MEVGEIWAYREKAYTEGYPVLPVEILQFGPPRSNKVRVRFLDGEYPGIDQWIPKVRLRVPWEQAEAWLQDERRFALAREVSREAYLSLEYEAAMTTVSAYPRPDGILIGYGIAEGATVMVADIATVARDLSLNVDELLAEPLAFVDRHGTYVGPWSVAYRLARRVAAVYPDGVLARVVAEERQLWQAATRGESFELRRGEHVWIPPERCAERLRERQPVLDLIRSWTGSGAAERYDDLTALRDEVARLRGLVEAAAGALQRAGQRHEARRLRKELE